MRCLTRRKGEVAARHAATAQRSSTVTAHRSCQTLIRALTRVRGGAFLGAAWPA
jgi:hypothetical protein